MISRCTRRITSIALDAPGARRPSATRSVLSRPKITGRCARSNVSSVAALSGNARKASITMRLLRRATIGAGENAGNLHRRWNRNHREIPRAAAAIRRSGTVGGGRVDFHPLAGRGADRAEAELNSAALGSAIVQTQKTRFLVQHEDEKIIVIVVFNLNRRCDAERLNDVGNGIAMTHDQNIAG